MFKPYIYPKNYDLSGLYNIKAKTLCGEELSVPVLKNIVADFASVEFDEEVEFEVEVRVIDNLKPESVSVRPVSRGIGSRVEGRKIYITMKKPENIKIDVDGQQDLFLYCFQPEKPEERPDANNPEVFYFKAGQTYEVGKLELRSNQTLYIEAGAVLYGVVHGTGDNIRIMGRGIIDGGNREDRPVEKRHTIQLEYCTNSIIRDVTIINPTSWIVVLGGCKDIICRNLKELGINLSTDGIDVCGSKNVLIEDCFIKCNDDCIVVKSLLHRSSTRDWRLDAENITTRRCVFQTVTNGAVMEIGHELITEKVENIVFEDCDVLSVNGHGTVFSIQNTDKAVISKVLYHNIRIEHCFEKLLNFRVMDSMFSSKTGKGQVRGIKLKDIYWTTHSYNQGYTVSLIGGLDPEHTVEDVEFDNFVIDGKRVTNLDELNIFQRYAANIYVKEK